MLHDVAGLNGSSQAPVARPQAGFSAPQRRKDLRPQRQKACVAVHHASQVVTAPPSTQAVAGGRGPGWQQYVPQSGGAAMTLGDGSRQVAAVTARHRSNFLIALSLRFVRFICIRLYINMRRCRAPQRLDGSSGSLPWSSRSYFRPISSWIFFSPRVYSRTVPGLGAPLAWRAPS